MFIQFQQLTTHFPNVVLSAYPSLSLSFFFKALVFKVIFRLYFIHL